MSTRYSGGGADPHALIPFGEDLLDSLVKAARDNPRKRMILRFHEHDEPVQRMLNAVEPESYARPHRHPLPTKHEAFVVLRGSLLVARFNDEGRPLEGYVLSAAGPVQGIEVPPGEWHTIVSLEPGTVMFEVNSGPYDATTHKEFAPWAPPEENAEAGAAYVAALRAYFEPVLPRIAALDVIQAEEEEIL